MKIDTHHLRIITQTIIYIEEDPEAIPIAVNIDDFLKKLRFNIGDISGRRIFYQDRFGSVDEIVTRNGRFTHLSPAHIEIRLKIQNMLKGQFDD